MPLPLPGEVRIHSPTRIHSGSPPHASPVIVDIWLHSGQHVYHLPRRKCGCNLHAGDTGRGNRACCGTCASRIFAAEQPCPVCRQRIDRLKKPRTETASFDAYYFRNLPKIHVDAARVPVHSGMHGSPIGLSVNHPCMHAVHMNPWKHACAQQQKWIGACNRASEHI